MHGRESGLRLDVHLGEVGKVSGGGVESGPPESCEQEWEEMKATGSLWDSSGRWGAVSPWQGAQYRYVPEMVEMLRARAGRKKPEQAEEESGRRGVLQGTGRASGQGPGLQIQRGQEWPHSKRAVSDKSRSSWLLLRINQGHLHTITPVLLLCRATV